MSQKVTKEFKTDFDYCMAYWKDLKDGFTDDDVTEAKAFARMIISDGDKARIEEMERWFKQEADRIRAIVNMASGITDRMVSAVGAA